MKLKKRLVYAHHPSLCIEHLFNLTFKRVEQW